MTILSRGRALLLALTLAGTSTLAGATSVFANFPLVSVVGSCNAQGQEVATWTVTNSEAGSTGQSMTISGLTLDKGTLTGITVGMVLPPQPQPGSTVTGTSVYPGNFNGTATLTVTGTFPSSSGTESATVFFGGTCTPQQTTQTIAGHIFDCTGGTATTTEVPGGTIGASGPQTVPTQANPLNPTNVAAGTYSMSSTAPAGFQFVMCGGNANIASPTSATESVIVPSGGAGVGIFYVARITQPGPPLAPGMTATMGFWNSRNGQALINSLNGGSTSTSLGTWLATNFSNLFGPSCANLGGATNAQVAAAFQADFALTGTAKQDTAQFFAVALAAYSTSTNLAGGNAAAGFGFTTSSDGTGSATFNVGSNGAAFGVANNTTLTVMQLLQGANQLASNCRTSDAAASVFDSVNSTGDIS